MIIAKTPLRIPMAGGLTDLKQYAARFGGVTVSSSIDQFTYATLKKNANDQLRLNYQDVRETVTDVDDVRNDLIREALKLTGLHNEPLELSVMVDLAGESGLGTSGSICVSLLHAMHVYKGETVNRQQLLEEASQIEVEILEGASGYHDPSICAVGGLKLFEYDGATATHREIAATPETRQAFSDSMLFFYGGRHAKSKPSLALLDSHMDDALDVLHEIKAIGYQLEDAFGAGDMALIAKIFGEQQRLKEQLPGKFTDDYVADIVERVRQTGAYAQLPGGKISAFVMVCCPDGQHDRVRQVLRDHTEVTFNLETAGTQVAQI